MWVTFVSLIEKFQFPPLREGRRACCQGYNLSFLFQFPPLREGRLGPRISYFSIVKFQFPPLREGRLRSLGPKLMQAMISIPAPARGATQSPSRLLSRHFYFNSRPCARGDLYRAWEEAGAVYFNSRPCARGDVSRQPIHSAAKDFNSRPCARGDRTSFRFSGSLSSFQFPPLREGRQQI